MRTTNSIRNLITALLGQGIGLLASLASRMVFLHYLGKSYLGINGLFTELMTMLSLVELGIGPAIVFSLYKPLAEKDDNQVHALMELFRKAYVTIGFLIALLGFVMLPFLKYIVKGVSEIPHIQLIFLLFVLNSSVSYFYSYKRSLIIADQRRYIATIYRYTFYILVQIAQMLALYLTGNYLLYLALQVTFTLVENMAVSQHANRLYPFLKNRSTSRLDGPTTSQIIQNTKAMIFHRLGGIVVNSTHNLLLSILVGTVWVGLYSNYQLIIQALHTITNQIFSSFTASVGNLYVTETTQKAQRIFRAVFFIDFWIFGFCAICFYHLVNPFILLWLGEDLLLPTHLVLIITVNFYVRGMRQAVLTFRDAFGLYWQDRYKPIFEIIINLIASIWLTRYFGMVGIFYGTLASTLLTCFWIEPYVLFKCGFNTSPWFYFFQYLYYTIAIILVGIATGVLCAQIPYAGISGFLLRGIVCAILPNFCFALFFHRTQEFQYLWDKIRNIFSMLKMKLSSRTKLS